MQARGQGIGIKDRKMTGTQQTQNRGKLCLSSYVSWMGLGARQLHLSNLILISRTSIDLIKYYLNNLDIDALVLSKMVAVQDNQGLKYWSCNDCNYMKRSKGDVFKHVERKHVDLEVHCVYCHLVYKSRPELLTHVKAKHPSA